MRIAWTSPIMPALVLAGLVASLPVVQADESGDASMKRQLEEVRQQLRELQLRVERMEAERRASAADRPGSAASSTPPSAPTQTTVKPRPATQPPVAAEPAEAAPAPPSTPARTEIAPSEGNPEPAAAARIEAGAPQAPPAVTEALQWHETLKDQWRSVKAGMSGEDIRKLLGAPSREFTIDGKPVWYYSYPGLGRGSVLFSRKGHTVTGWQHPPLGLGFGFW
jgi:hypothetical protein